MGNDVKPIQTVYAGCHFRSRLEARWAVFFDTLGVRWQYEVEGYETPHGMYLPDFWLPELEYSIEIKPSPPTEIEQAKLASVGKYLDAKGAFIATEPIKAIHSIWDKPTNFYQVWPFWDCDYRWCVCSDCGRFEIKFEGRSDRMSCKCCAKCHYGVEHECSKSGGCRRSEHGDKGYADNDPVLARAYARATMARFEHGETPR